MQKDCKSCKLISELQLVSDELAYKIIKERSMNAKLNILQEYCSFNTNFLVYLPSLTQNEFIMFLLNNKDKFKRKLNEQEFCKLSSKFKVGSRFFQIGDIVSFKSLSIKKADKT